jgi:hypothetical protein
MLYAHRTRVLATIAEWTQAVALIDSKIDFYGEWLATGRRPQHLRAPDAQAAAASPRRVAPRRSGRRRAAPASKS